MTRRNRNLFFIDTETTGLKPPAAEILQVAVILTDPSGNNVLEEYQARLKPQHIETADTKALSINGYKAEDYTDESCTPHNEVARKLCNLMQGAIPVGQNVKFDQMMVEAFLGEQGLKPTWHYHSLDTMVLAWPFFQAKEIDYFNLDTLCDYFDVDRPQIHTAKDDIAATYLVYHRLMERLSIKILVDV